MGAFAIILDFPVILSALTVFHVVAVLFAAVPNTNYEA